MHKSVFEAIVKRYPFFTIYQEYAIEVKKDGKRKILFIDIYVDEIKLAIECNGIQHYKYTDFFHGSSESFKRSVVNDNEKREWCEANDIILLQFKYNEKLTEKHINDRIDNALRG